jgi:hypothetical protein
MTITFRPAFEANIFISKSAENLYDSLSLTVTNENAEDVFHLLGRSELAPSIGETKNKYILEAFIELKEREISSLRYPTMPIEQLARMLDYKNKLCQILAFCLGAQLPLIWS